MQEKEKGLRKPTSFHDLSVRVCCNLSSGPPFLLLFPVVASAMTKSRSMKEDDPDGDIIQVGKKKQRKERKGRGDPEYL